jgi:sirohydrochlorin ferrochelatase
VTAPAFVLTSDLSPRQPDWIRAQAQAKSLAEPAARILGFMPEVRLASLPMHPAEDAGECSLEAVLDEVAASGAAEILVLPASLGWNVGQRERFGETLAEFRRSHAHVKVFHDDPDPCHPLVVECFADTAMRVLAGRQIPPQRAGLLVVASGHGDAGSRAQSYRLMRLLWEQLSSSRADVAFLRHAQVFLSTALERCASDPLHWILVPQSQWWTEHVDYARTILDDFHRAHPDCAEWTLASPPGDHPSLSAWFTQRMTRLWREKQSRDEARAPSVKSAVAECAPRVWSGDRWEPLDDGAPRTGFIARARNRDALAAVLAKVLPASDTYVVKVTWHGYAPGTYTDAAALDLLLGALPGRAVILEGHTSSRNLGGADWDWETEARQHRAWIKQQDAEYLRRTGLADVIARHRAEYVNVTEEYWDGRCLPASVALDHPELAGFVPESLAALAGAPFLSFARFKGPTRLGISNLFGLIPAPVRSAWHGTNITDFASVCCDLAKLYGALFPMYGVVEALHSAVRWDRKGLYRSRWGNYDVVLSDGIVTISEGLAGADILASRLQGQDVSHSAFFDVVKQDLIKQKVGWPGAAVAQALPLEVQTRFA